MGKGPNDFLKAVANASKSKGLQKLRWYCQVCAKQCRDENGFKCHCTSEGHLRQMEIFGMNQGRFVEGYSEEFLKDFLNLLAVSHRNSRVSATIVYNEYIANKNHVHMNSTKWTTLTEFIKHLGREGICEIDETPKGWFLVYRPEDKEEKMRLAQKGKRERAHEEEEERNARLIREQIERAHRELPEHAKIAAEATALRRSEGDESAALKLSIGAGNKRLRADAGALALAGACGDAAALEVFKKAQQVASDAATAAGAGGGKRSALEEIMKRDMAAKAGFGGGFDAAGGAAGASGGGGGDRPWLAHGIVVKILSKALQSEGLYKKKAVVRKVVDGGYVGEVAALDSGDRVRVDQAELETVLPSVGGAVLVLRGEHRGVVGKLAGVRTAEFKAEVTLREGPMKGRTAAFDYEDVCKLHAQ